MAYYQRSGTSTFGFDLSTPPMIKRLLIANFSVFVVYFIAVRLEFEPLLWLFRALSLIPNWLIFGAVWQPFTYLFLHSPYGFSHILWNMLALWMFGRILEQHFGSKRFLQFYFFCGVGAGLFDVVARIIWGSMDSATIGNSGAVYGIVLAFGYLFPRMPIYLFPLPVTIPAWVLAAFYGGMSFLSLFDGPNTGVAHVAHLTGMLMAWIFITRRPTLPDIDWQQSYRNWRLRRARRKFEVYMNKRDRGDGGGWVN